MNLKTKQITQTALLLAICIISQFLKNTSVYLTGPIINAALLIALLCINVKVAILLSCITPITAFLITGSPIMAGIPLMFPVIMLGNVLLVICTWAFYKKKKNNVFLWTGMFTGCVTKAVFMWIMTSFILFPLFGDHIAGFIPKPEALPKILGVAKITFSLTQFITAFIGCVLTVFIMIPLRKFLINED